MQTLQGAFTSGELSPSLAARVDFNKYGQGCTTLKNFLVQPHGGAVKRPGFKLLDTLPGRAALIPFVFNNEQAYCLVLGAGWMRVATETGFVLGNNGKVLEIPTPYTLFQALQLSTAQSGDVLFMACAEQAPHMLKRYAHNRWVFERMVFTSPVGTPAPSHIDVYNAAVKSDGSHSPAVLSIPYHYVVTAVDKEGKEGNPSSNACVTGPSASNWQAGDYIRLYWNAAANADEYRIYKGLFSGKPGFIAATREPYFHDINISPVSTRTPPVWKDPFTAGDYPAVVGFFEQRLVFASTLSRPQTIWLSRSGDYSNFSSSMPVQADDAIELTIASKELSRMHWLVALRSLIMGSSGVEWELSSSEGGFSARTARVSPQSYRGSAALPAMVIGNAVLHVARSGQEVRDLKYEFGSDSYGGTDRTILSRHLFENHIITNWTYQAAPDSTVWVVRDDGVLLGMTYQQEHDVCAWHRHTTKGKFMAVCATPSPKADNLFALVERKGTYSLELMAPRYYGGPAKDTVFLDCSLIYKGSPTTTVTGLETLEGQEVHVLGDGGTHPSCIVQGGRIILTRPCSTVIAGLPYSAELETMPVEIMGQEGASVTRKKVIHAVNVLFQNTITGRIGTSFSRMESISARTTEPHGTPPEPFNGTKRVVVANSPSCTATVCICSDEPLPMTVLALSPEVTVK